MNLYSELARESLSGSESITAAELVQVNRPLVQQLSLGLRARLPRGAERSELLGERACRRERSRMESRIYKPRRETLVEASHRGRRRGAHSACRFAASLYPHLYFFLVAILMRSTSFHAQTHLPAQPASPLEDAWIPYPDEDQERPGSNLAPARQGSQAGFSEARFPRVDFPI